MFYLVIDIDMYINTTSFIYYNILKTIMLYLFCKLIWVIKVHN